MADRAERPQAPVPAAPAAFPGAGPDAELDRFHPDRAFARADADTRADLYHALYDAYRSLQNVAAVYRRQLDVVREQTLHGAQVADFARKLNVAEADRIGDVIMADLPRMTGARAGALYLFDAEKKRLELFRAAPPAEPPPPSLHAQDDADRLFMHLLLHHRAPFAVAGRADYERIAGRSFARGPGEEILEDGALVCPLSIDAMGQDPIPVGLLVLAGKPDGFNRHDLERAAMISEMIAASLNTAALLHRMHVLAETDGVTGLFNHRHFQQELDRFVALVRRYEEPLSLALLDIDWFKSVNDAYGHQFGDHVLRAVADTIKGSVRVKVDVVARYGGEEFAVIMPNTGREGAMLTAERIRANVQKMALTHQDKPLLVTVSGGVSTFARGREKSELIAAADGALYAAKDNGRNRVEFGAIQPL